MSSGEPQWQIMARGSGEGKGTPQCGLDKKGVQGEPVHLLLYGRMIHRSFPHAVYVSGPAAS